MVVVTGSTVVVVSVTVDVLGGSTTVVVSDVRVTAGRVVVTTVVVSTVVVSTVVVAASANVSTGVVVVTAGRSQ